MPVLTAIDVLGVQRYVFASSRLRDVISASWLVHWATARDGALCGVDAEVLLAAGGNAILETPDVQLARAFAGAYSRRLLDQAPGLDVVMVQHPFEVGGLARALALLQQEVARAKLGRVPSTEQLGLGVTASCRITGLPAVATDSDGPMSSMVARWRDEGVREAAIERWSAPPPFTFPTLIDDLGRSRGEASLLGVVHLDGNGVGAAIRDWLQAKASAPDAEVREAYREWSGSLDERVAATWAAVVERVRRSVVDGQILGPRGGAPIQLGSEGRLPIRPVLAGGDDLTFLCDGRLALDLAAEALRAFAAQEVRHLGRGSACAGVALVPIHFPFSRAYDLAEQLCQSAKAGRRARQDDGPWLDWQIGPPTPGEPVSTHRARALHGSVDGRRLRLTCRPYPVGARGTDLETWRWLAESVLGPSSGAGLRGTQWSVRRNKVKELVSLVRGGPDEVRRTLSGWRVAAPALALPGGLDETGFLDGQRTPLVDAIELLDLHYPLPDEGAA